MKNKDQIERTYIDHSTYGYEVPVTVYKPQKQSRDTRKRLYGVLPFHVRLSVGKSSIR